MGDDSAEISRLERADTLGLAVVRAVILLNGGAILAMLAFVSNSSNEAAVAIDSNSIKLAISMFLVGIISILLALSVSYTYTASAPETRYHQFWGRWIITLNAILTFISLSAFALGVVMIVIGTEARTTAA